MIKGKSYNYQKVLQININNFIFEGNNSISECYSLKNEEGEEFTDKLRFIHFYLPNIKNKYKIEPEKLSKLEKLLLVYSDNNKVAEELGKGDIVMEEYIKDAKDASINDEVIGLYDKELHLEKLHLSEIRDAKLEGIEQGSMNKSIEIAKNMIKNDIDITIISNCTGLSEEEIESIK